MERQINMERWLCFWILSACFFAFLWGFKAVEVRQLRIEAVKYGFAIYEPTNGVWQWNLEK